VSRLLRSWLDAPATSVRRGDRDDDADIVVEHGKLRLAIECKASGDSAAVGRAIAQVSAYARHHGRGTVPVVAVQFMGDVGKRLCAAAGVSWLDLSGNANIVAPGLRILIEGKPNKFLRRGRPSTAFAPKSARIARRLLIEPGRSFRQQELARETGLDDGFTSRIVHRLEEDGLLDREKDGAVRVRNADLLLDAWTEVYDFQKHAVLRGHIATRSSEELPRRLAEAFVARKVRHSATGLAAAWLHTKFAGFRIVTFFVAKHPSEALLREIGFREEPKGANVWLVVPNDDGVFDGSEAKNGVTCTHPVQTYVDLQGHPERAREAADELRKRLLRWKP
jgi:CRP-like cAMP-binding protein